MKKMTSKFSSIKEKIRATPEPVKPEADRVTNNTVSKHREEMLSRARKFKYPFHRSKHRVALISVFIVVTAIMLLGIFTSVRLYVRQNSDEFTYRVTQILPFPVARVNGSYTSYENYLFQLRHNVFWLEQYGTTDLKSPDGQRQIDYLKRSALDKAMAYTIAKKLAKAENITVTDEEIDVVVQRLTASGGDLKSILRDQLNLTEQEYRRLTSEEILKAKVAKALDKEAPAKAEDVLKQIKAGKSFADLAKANSDDAETKQLGGEFGVVERGKVNLPKEVSDKIFELKKDQVSEVIPATHDYFIVKVLDRVDKDRAKVAIIRISVKDMDEYLQEYRKDNKVKEYVELKEVSSQQLSLK